MLDVEEINLVVLDSPGGVVFDAIVIAERIHDLGLATLVPEGAECMSSCVYVFLGGQQRLASGALWAHRMQVAGSSGDTVLFEANDMLSEVLGFTRRIVRLGAPDWLMDIIQTSPELVPLTPTQQQELAIEPSAIASSYDLNNINAALAEIR